MKNQAATIAEALEYGWLHRHGYNVDLTDQHLNVDGTVIWELRKICNSKVGLNCLPTGRGWGG